MAGIALIIICSVIVWSMYYVGYTNGKSEAREVGIQSFFKVVTELTEALKEANVTEEQMATINAVLERNKDSQREAYESEN